MAAAVAKYAEDFGRSTGTSAGTFVTGASIAAGDLLANKKYLVVGMGNVSVGNTTTDWQARMRRGTTVISGGSDALTINCEGRTSTTSREMFGFLAVDTQPGTAAAYEMQVAPESTTAHTADTNILALKLSDDFTEDTDYWFNEITTDNTVGTTWEDGASETISVNGTDTFLVIASIIYDDNDTANSMQFAINVDGVRAPIAIREGKDVANRVGSLLIHRVTPASGSRVFKIEFQQTAGTAANVAYSNIFVLKLNKFSQFATDYTEAEIDPAETGSWTNLAGVDPNPSVTGDWAIFGFAVYDFNSLGEAGAIRLQVNPSGGGLTSQPGYGDDAPGDGGCNDGTGELPCYLMTLESLTSGAAREINLDGQHIDVSDSTEMFEDRCLVAFSLELASTGTTLSPGFTTQTRAIYSAKVSPTLKPGLITQTRAIYAPDLDITVAPAFLAQTRALYSPKVNPTLLLGFTAQTRAVYSPTVDSGTALLPDFLTHTRAIYTPLVHPQIRPGFTVQTRAVYGPTVGPTLKPAALTHARAIYSPNVVNTMLPAFLTHARSTFSPRVNVTVKPARIDHGRALYMPGVNDGSAPPATAAFRPEHPGQHDR